MRGPRPQRPGLRRRRLPDVRRLRHGVRRDESLREQLNSGRRRWLILGAGAIGAGLGGLLRRAGEDVVLVARGAQLAALQNDGLRLKTPRGSERLRIPTVPVPLAAAPAVGDVVIVTTKLQDAGEALDGLLECAPPGLRVVCAQNGLAGPRLATARGFDASPAMVWMPATCLIPGEVRLHGAPIPGLVLVRDPDVSSTLGRAGIDSSTPDELKAWCAAKFVRSVVGVLHALGIAAPDRANAARAEAIAVLGAANIDVLPPEALEARIGHVGVGPIDGSHREGGSVWQSLRTGRPTEIAWLTGEVVALGREHDVATPANDAILEHAGVQPRPPIPSTQPAS